MSVGNLKSPKKTIEYIESLFFVRISKQNFLRINICYSANIVPLKHKQLLVSILPKNLGSVLGPFPTATAHSAPFSDLVRLVNFSAPESVTQSLSLVGMSQVWQ